MVSSGKRCDFILNLIEFRYLRRVETAKLGGALVLKADNSSGEVSLMWGHSTYCLGVGYMRKGDKRPHVSINNHRT